MRIVAAAGARRSEVSAEAWEADPEGVAGADLRAASCARSLEIHVACQSRGGDQDGSRFRAVGPPLQWSDALLRRCAGTGLPSGSSQAVSAAASAAIATAAEIITGETAAGSAATAITGDTAAAVGTVLAVGSPPDQRPHQNARRGERGNQQNGQHLHLLHPLDPTSKHARSLRGTGVARVRGSALTDGLRQADPQRVPRPRQRDQLRPFTALPLVANSFVAVLPGG